MNLITNIDQAFEELNTILDAAGALDALTTQRAVYRLRLEIARATGDSERIHNAELALRGLEDSDGQGAEGEQGREAVEIAHRLARDEYFISRLATAMYLTYEVDGDEVIFDHDMRAQVEQLLGCELEAFTSRRYAGEVGLRIPRAKLTAVRERLGALQSALTQQTREGGA